MSIGMTRRNGDVRERLLRPLRVTSQITQARRVQVVEHECVTPHGRELLLFPTQTGVDREERGDLPAVLNERGGIGRLRRRFQRHVERPGGGIRPDETAGSVIDVVAMAIVDAVRIRGTDKPGAPTDVDALSGAAVPAGIVSREIFLIGAHLQLVPAEVAGDVELDDIAVELLILMEPETARHRNRLARGDGLVDVVRHALARTVDVRFFVVGAGGGVHQPGRSEDAGVTEDAVVAAGLGLAFVRARRSGHGEEGPERTVVIGRIAEDGERQVLCRGGLPGQLAGVEVAGDVFVERRTGSRRARGALEVADDAVAAARDAVYAPKTEAVGTM